MPESKKAKKAKEADPEVKFKPLSERERAFCKAILLGKNKRQAVIEAGWAESCAGARASEVLQRPHVQDYLRQFYEQEAAETRIQRELIRRKMFDSCMVELRGIFADYQWKLVDPHEVPDAAWPLISSVKKTEGEMGNSTSVKLVPQSGLWVDYLKLFPPPVENGGLDLSQERLDVQRDFEDLLKQLEDGAT